MCKSVLLLQYLESINQFVRENLRQLEHAPGIQMQDVPRDLIDLDNLDRDDEADVDVRESAEELERRCVFQSQMFFSDCTEVRPYFDTSYDRVVPRNEYYDGDHDNDKPDSLLDVV